MSPGLTIGEFAALTQLSIRSLRRYHDAGLLEPARVDAHTGYRYYDQEQIGPAQMIHRLRELDVPLAEIGRLLQTTDPGERGELLARHLARTEAELARLGSAVASLRQLLRPDPPAVDVEIRSLPARSVAAVRAEVARDDVLTWYGRAVAELDQHVGPAARRGPLGGRYDNELFTHGRGRAMVFRPARGVSPRGRVDAVTLEPVDLATTVHTGPHDDIEVTYGRLGSWVVRNALTLAGPVEESYLIGPADNPDPASWRTAIGWPVLGVTGGSVMAR
ncbi:MerR family transcriptional regulator [Nakamurella sp.]|uniref:MerR family transcriptional regulator n=1 Tax=Nakamurella sp. TaxID=1869182 RepID=UPI003783346F